jgi:hypothetical protein
VLNLGSLGEWRFVCHKAGGSSDVIVTVRLNPCHPPSIMDSPK